MSFNWVQLSMITVTCSGGDVTGLIFWLACKVKFVSVYTSDEQTTARGPDAARLEVLSGPRQVLK